MSDISDSSAPFGWSQRRDHDIDVISLAGELDLAAAADLRSRLLSVAESSTAPAIVLDLSQVTFIDAQCAGIVVAAWETARARGTQLRVDGLQGMPEFVFGALGLGPTLAAGAQTSDGVRNSGGRISWIGRVARRSGRGTHAAG